jgi:glutathionylspermidine synthase
MPMPAARIAAGSGATTIAIASLPDTPTSLLESAVAQWYWLEECFPQHDQFNSLHDRLVERWKQLGSSVTTIYFASSSENEEDWVCTAYLMDTATQAGYWARHIYIEDIGWHAPENALLTLTAARSRPCSNCIRGNG